MDPKISIVTICYNSVSVLEETMLSVLNQTYPNIEYIIIDGGSTDGTVDIIKKYADRLAYWVSEPDKGIYDAMNKGIAAATGEYVIFTNSGDRLVSSVILSEVVLLELKEDVIYGHLIMQFNEVSVLAFPDELSLFSRKFPIYHPATLTRLDLLKETLYNLKFKICGDYDFYWKIYYQGKSFRYINKTIAVFDAREGISNNKIIETFVEGSKVNGSYGSAKFMMRLCLLVFRQIGKRCLFSICPAKMKNREAKKILSNPLYKKL